MGALNSLLVFGEIISDLKQECQAEVENHNIQDCGSEVIMDYILLFKIFLAIILKYFLCGPIYPAAILYDHQDK